MTMLPKTLLLAALLAAGGAVPPMTAAAAEKPSLPPPPPPDVKPEVKYKPGSGFTLVQAEDFSLAVTGRVQARYEYDDWDGDRDIPNLSKFTAERVRFGAKGTMFKDWKYELEAEFGKNAFSLKKGFIEYAKYEQARIEMGQFNLKFDRSQYTSSAKQQFVDRSIAAGTFGHEYDVGLDVAGAAFDKKFQYNVGVFDGEKTNKVNNNDGHAYVARVSFNPNGDFGVGESDIKKTDYHLWYVDVAGMWNNDLWTDANADKKESADELTDEESLAFGFGYKHAGLFLAGEYYQRSSDKEDATPSVDGSGWYAQLGYTIVRDKWEVAARYSEVDPDDDKDDDHKTEWVVGVNRYFRGVGHALKFQTDFSWLGEEKAPPTDDFGDFRLRSQLQVVF